MYESSEWKDSPWITLDPEGWAPLTEGRTPAQYRKKAILFHQEDAADAEAYWSLVLCRYGVEYVEDPATHARIPTINRTQFTSVFDDENYRSALAHAGVGQRAIYEREAEAINRIQKGILEISEREAPFDVFLCYKETDENGQRTIDSTLAQDIYYQLTEQGRRVFFARITLEDKAGQEYEPYIFAALHSAKVMVVVGTRPEYLNAVWVRNEWSRYLALMKHDRKRLLIPCYRDMDPYDLPEQLAPEFFIQRRQELQNRPRLSRRYIDFNGTHYGITPLSSVNSERRLRKPAANWAATSRFPAIHHMGAGNERYMASYAEQMDKKGSRASSASTRSISSRQTQFTLLISL